MSLALHGVTRIFDTKGASHTAVSDLSLDIEAGCFYTLLGPSGCGKTTLLRMIAGFEQPTSGEIRLHGRLLNGVPPHERGLPMVFQSYALFPHMTVFDNVGYGLKLRKIARADIKERADRVLELLELTSQKNKHPAQLSGGQQQRVALARALVLEPEVILLDEPLSNLDAGLRVAMREEIRALQQRLRITAIYVTHDQEEALAISDRIVVMNAGRIEQAGTPIEGYRHPRTRFVARFMGNTNIFPVTTDAQARLMLLGQPIEVTYDAAAAHVVVRADTLQFSESGRHRATVERATFLGARVKYELKVGDDRLLIERTADADVFQEGGEVRFDIAADQLHFLTEPAHA